MPGNLTQCQRRAFEGRVSGFAIIGRVGPNSVLREKGKCLIDGLNLFKGFSMPADE
jgi:hypothetical protein